MKVQICIGSSCHVRGSKQVIETLMKLTKEHEKEVEIACSKGVSIRIGEQIYHVKPEDAEDFFHEVILKEAQNAGN